LWEWGPIRRRPVQSCVLPRGRPTAPSMERVSSDGDRGSSTSTTGCRTPSLRVGPAKPSSPHPPPTRRSRTRCRGTRARGRTQAGDMGSLGGATRGDKVHGVRVLQATTLVNVLVQWGLHEARGRLRASLPPDVLQRLDRSEGSAIALDLILRSRAPVIASILAAAPIGGCSAVEVQPEDFPSIRVIGPPPLSLREYSSQLLAQDTDSGRWARGLVPGSDVEGPCLAVARSLEGPLTILDGLHRAAVWAAHHNGGRNYALTVNLIETEKPTWYERQ